jgi:hypothetical protein
MFLIGSAFVGKIILYLSKCTVKQQLRILDTLDEDVFIFMIVPL